MPGARTTLPTGRRLHACRTLGLRGAALDAAHGPRTVAGLGVSNAHSVAGAGQVFGTPTGSMRSYLDRLDTAPDPVPASRRVLGALGPKMADLAATRTAGWHPFMVTPDYSAAHRARVGPGPVIAPHQAVVLDRDPDRARATARPDLGTFIGSPPARRARVASTLPTRTSSPAAATGFSTP